MVDIQSAIAEIWRGKKKRRKKQHGKNIMSASATQGGHNYHLVAVELPFIPTQSDQLFASDIKNLPRKEAEHPAVCHPHALCLPSLSFTKSVTVSVAV